MDDYYKSPEKIREAARDAETRVSGLMQIAEKIREWSSIKEGDSMNSAYEAIVSLINLQQRMEVTAHGYWTRIGYDPSFEDRYARKDVLAAYNKIYDEIEDRIKKIESSRERMTSKKVPSKENPKKPIIS